MRIDTRLITPKLYYFGFFAAVGATLPYLPLHYREIGLDEAQIGLIGSLPSLIALLAVPLWTSVADALRLHRLLLPLSLIGWSGTMVLLSQPVSLAPVMALVSLQAFIGAPVTPLADSGVLALLGERRDLYGRQRLWGSIGYALSAFAGGWLIGMLGTLKVVFVLHAACALIALTVSARLPAGSAVQANLRKGIGQLLRDPRWAALLGSVFLLYVGNAANVGFRTLFFQDIGMGSLLIGATDALSSAIEIPIMLGSAALFRRHHPGRLMVLAGGLYVSVALIQWLVPIPPAVMAAHLLRGVAFALFWTSGVLRVQAMAPPGMNATAQGLFGAGLFSLATSMANPLVGYIYQSAGSARMFMFAAACCTLATVGLWLSGRLATPAPAPAAQSES